MSTRTWIAEPGEAMWLGDWYKPFGRRDTYHRLLAVMTEDRVHTVTFCINRPQEGSDWFVSSQQGLQYAKTKEDVIEIAETWVPAVIRAFVDVGEDRHPLH